MDLHFQSRRKPRTAEKLNEMARRLNIQGFGVTASPLGTTLANRRVYYAKKSPNFECTLSGSTVTVTAGNIDLHDIDSYAVAETSVVLSGETEWVFVWHMKDHSASGIDHQASVKPKTDGNMWRWPLAKYTLSGTSYTQKELCREYDISESNPLR